MNKKNIQCKNCGSFFVQKQENYVPVEYSFVDTIGRALLMLIPVIGWIALLSRKSVQKQTILICTQCGWKKDITKKPLSNRIAKALAIIYGICLILLGICFLIAYFMDWIAV
ncbi:MAG: hypothetical protein K2G88_09110 [Oscillospiraceae bacterium]|nr:hypothetical protein [Oscillospiraceae bacterium]MDE6005529.1 hypothetical protein [Oscillospiraceae bacterium]